MSYPKETVTVSAKLLLVMLFVVVFANGKKTKNCLADPEDGSEDLDAEVFCKKLTRLIRMEKADEIVVVDSAPNSSVLLQCKYCEERGNGLPKVWRRQKHIFTGNITEVQTNMNNNVSASSIFITKSHSLVFRSLQESDVGLYFCQAPYVDSPDKSFNYLIDLTSGGKEEIKGTLSDLRNFTQSYLGRVNAQLANQTFSVRSLTIKMKVFSDWSDWSQCDSCFRKGGVKHRLGRCRVKPICQDARECAEDRLQLKGFEFNDKQNTERPARSEGEIVNPRAVEANIMEFGIALSCRSLLLMQLNPELYNIVSNIPDFLLSEKCSTQCKNKSPKRDPRYRKSIILAKGAHLTLVCPDSTIDSQILWEHNNVKLPPNGGTDYIPGSNEPRQYVDSFNTLYLFEVTDRESGNYTCFVDGMRMQEVKIIVLTRSLFFTKEFTRHLKYLGFVFFVCFVAYLSGVIIMCIKTHSERLKNSKKKKQVLEDSEKLLEKEECNCDLP